MPKLKLKEMDLCAQYKIKDLKRDKRRYRSRNKRVDPKDYEWGKLTIA